MIAFQNALMTINILQRLPVVQLSAFEPAAHIHNPSVCRQARDWQLDGHFCEQFSPKYPSVQARG